VAALGGRPPVTAPLAALRGATAPRGGGGTTGVCGSVGGSAGSGSSLRPGRPSAPCRTTARGQLRKLRRPRTPARPTVSAARPEGTPADPRLASASAKGRRNSPAIGGHRPAVQMLRGDDDQEHEPGRRRRVVNDRRRTSPTSRTPTTTGRHTIGRPSGADELPQQPELVEPARKGGHAEHRLLPRRHVGPDHGDGKDRDQQPGRQQGPLMDPPPDRRPPLLELTHSPSHPSHLCITTRWPPTAVRTPLQNTPRHSQRVGPQQDQHAHTSCTSAITCLTCAGTTEPQASHAVVFLRRSTKVWPRHTRSNRGGGQREFPRPRGNSGRLGRTAEDGLRR
jgi:hypothetical protein